MPTSELSDALNPNVIQSRRYENTNYSPPQQYEQVTSHGNSELGLAVVEPQRPKNLHPIQGIFRFLAASREAEQIERQRRLTWEHEQENRAAERQAEMDRRFLQMQQEISGLKSYIGHIQPMRVEDTLSPQHHASYPQSPEPTQPNVYPKVVQGSSSLIQEASSRYGRDSTPPISSGSSSNGLRSASHSRKRPTPASSSSDDDSSDQESTYSGARPQKRINGHDSRCLTIQRAMKLHIYFLMGIEQDDSLPESYIEGAPLEPDAPVRFIWERTVRQSPHNAKMKARVIKDLVEHRHLYEHVPENDFDPILLDSVFDQTFITLRRNSKAQRDEATATKRRRMEATKSVKTRRTTRKRAKLGTRSTSRQKLDRFSHCTFDGALQLDCMSSEESDHEQSGEYQVLSIRRLPWRSSRLVRLYETLDQEHQSTTKPKGGAAGKRKKLLGPMKEGYLLLPPKGVSCWMVSKRWLKSMRAVHKDLEEWLKPLLVDPPGFEWANFEELGEETDNEEEEDDNFNEQYHHSQAMQNASSSLQYALQL